MRVGNLPHQRVELLLVSHRKFNFKRNHLVFWSLVRQGQVNSLGTIMLQAHQRSPLVLVVGCPCPPAIMPVAEQPVAPKGNVASKIAAIQSKTCRITDFAKPKLPARLSSSLS